MFRTQRRRRSTPPVALALLSPVFRYSTTRDAYILRLIGRRRGPVLQRRAAPAARR